MHLPRFASVSASVAEGACDASGNILRGIAMRAANRFNVNATTVTTRSGAISTDKKAPEVQRGRCTSFLVSREKHGQNFRLKPELIAVVRLIVE